MMYSASKSIQIRYLTPLVIYIYVNHLVNLSIDLLLEAEAGRIPFAFDKKNMKMFLEDDK